MSWHEPEIHTYECEMCHWEVLCDHGLEFYGCKSNLCAGCEEKLERDKEEE